MDGLWSRLKPGRKRARTDVVGIDVGTAGTRVARIRRWGDDFTVVAADMLPHFAPPAANDTSGIRSVPLLLTGSLQGLYGALAVSTPQTIVRLLTIPGRPDRVTELDFYALLGLPEGSDYRIGYELLGGDSRAETVLLAAGLPETQARWAATLLPRGLPAPTSLQAAGVATLTAVSRDLASRTGETCALAVDIGRDISYVSAFYKGRLVLLRQCPIGNQALIKSVQESLGIEEDLVPGILDDSVVDVSQLVAAAMEPFLRQLVLAREFVERKRSCRVERVCLCGAVVGLAHWRARIGAALGLQPEVLNPFATMTVAHDALSERARGMEPRFVAAVGAALALLESAHDVSH